MGFSVAKFNKNRMGSRLGRSSCKWINPVFSIQKTRFFQDESGNCQLLTLVG